MHCAGFGPEPATGPGVALRSAQAEADADRRRAHYLTIHTDQLKPVFLDLPFGRVVVRQIMQTARHEVFELLAYCVLPDRADLVVRTHAPEADVRRFINRLKQRTGYGYFLRTGGPLWRPGFADRPLGTLDAATRTALHVMRAPVRAGLAATPEDYALSGTLKG